MDGSKVNGAYTNWADDQPDNNNGNETVLDMAGDGGSWLPTGTWNDQDRTVTQPYLCEKPAEGTSLHLVS